MNIMTKYTLHDHYRKKMRRSHWDLRIIRPDKKRVWSFALPKAKIPKKGEKILAIQTEDHHLSIMDFEGPLDNPKNKGDVIASYINCIDCSRLSFGTVIK